MSHTRLPDADTHGPHDPEGYEDRMARVRFRTSGGQIGGPSQADLEAERILRSKEIARHSGDPDEALHGTS